MEQPNIGSQITVGKSYFGSNVLIAQYFPLLAPNIVYEVLEMDNVGGEWGITKLKIVDTDDIIDINEIEALGDYWCLIDSQDSIRIIQ